MPRPPRVDHPGAFHHVMNRGTAGTMIFRTDADRRMFLRLLGELEARYGIRILAFVLMGNHYHLIVCSTAGHLAEAMWYLDGQYARRFNATHGRQGALFQGRYTNQRIDSDVQLEMATVYVHLNPVRAGLATRPETYRWSSLRAYVEERTPLPWLCLDLHGGRSGSEFLADTLRWVGDVAALDDGAEADGAEWWGGEPEPEPQRESTDCDHLIAASDRAVAEAFQVSIDELYIVSPGKANLPRMVAIVAAAGRTQAPRASLATRYGLRNPSAIQTAVRRLRTLVATDHDLALVTRGLGLRL